MSAMNMDVTPVKLVNLTKTVVDILAQDGFTTIQVFPERCEKPRVEEHRETVKWVAYQGVEIPVVRVWYGKVYNLPDPVEGTIYIVSNVVREAASDLGRDDVLCLGDIIRHGGVILGARTLRS